MGKCSSLDGRNIGREVRESDLNVPNVAAAIGRPDAVLEPVIVQLAKPVALTGSRAFLRRVLRWQAGTKVKP